MRCPACGSENTQRLAVIYESGTSHSSAKTQGSVYGSGVNLNAENSGVGLYSGSVNSTTSGVTQTFAAQRAAPPRAKTFMQSGLGKWSLTIALGAGAIAFIFGVGASGKTDYSWLWTTWVVCALVFALNAVLVADYNESTWKPQYQAWEKRWLCHKCGTVYEQ